MIVNAIRRAYRILAERNWDTVYWTIDLHGVCLKPDHNPGQYEFINQHAIDALRLISSLPESGITLWSSMHRTEQPGVIAFFAAHGIRVDYFNENPEITSTARADFSVKFYSSIILDDKAGFDPERDWLKVIDYLLVERGKAAVRA